ncbi:MAG: F0F1 ATP synthase subunit B [Bacillota bacterium]|nr:F0F1 ATP synthase subunit B [Bacillota bacterium]
MIRNRRVYLAVLFLSFIMVMGFATFCMASEQALDAAVPPPGGTPPAFGNWYVIGWSAVNFFVLLALLYKFAFNPINEMLEQRANTIESSIKHAEEVKVEVDQLRKEAQANLVESRKESQDIIGRATKAADEAKNEILAKAQEEVTTMKSKALSQIEAATEQAQIELRDTAAVLAIMAAEKVLGRAITEEDHKNMVKEFINEAGDTLC